MSGRRLYLAYGSNLHPARLRGRTPSAELLGTVTLPGWALCCNKRSIDGSAKCNVAESPAGVVYGAVYAMDPGEQAALDRAEGKGYAIHRLVIPELGRVFFYVARPQYLTTRLRPYRWYRDYVLLGARYHGLPEHYVRQVEDMAWEEDPDRARAALHERVIAALHHAGEDH